ncbi:winged helix DNA-binding protein [Enterocloster clostridioformis]|uniref:winged helix DNA-binding protein n=1 Tax=Enterocloster clostridioformis TaxID=1531 RepID=UPI00041381B1|nr:MarR family winged helix-turn-helix transcriptional regulator [Enterocloster clostridioformis]
MLDNGCVFNTDYIDHHHKGVTELAEEWVRTKGSISQVIKNLDENGYLIKKKEGNNNKNVHLYPTSKGVELSLAHKMYDARNLKNTLDFFTQYCTEEELTAFYKVLGYYTMLLKG